MASAYSITEGQANFPKMVKEVQSGCIATITKRDETVAHVVGKERMAAHARFPNPGQSSTSR
jgi:antitoxin (DNA-binding transcriptional repressor) of toxin-antitoxin stability system